MQVLKDFDQSRFWKRLDELSSEDSYTGDKESLDHLKASIRKVASRAKWINSQVELLCGDPGLRIRELLQNALELRVADKSSRQTCDGRSILNQLESSARKFLAQHQGAFRVQRIPDPTISVI